MKKVKKLLKLPALAALCFGLVLPLSSLGESGDKVNAERGGSVTAVRGGDADRAENYAFDGDDLDLAGGDALGSGLTTAAEWRYEKPSDSRRDTGKTLYSIYGGEYGAAYNSGLYDLTGDVSDDTTAVAYETAFAFGESDD